MTPTPTSEAWAYFILHQNDIREVVELFLPISRIEIPNTWVTLEARGPVLREETGAEQRASIYAPTTHTIAEFDSAAASRDVDSLFNIMNSAWLRAPEDREVYLIPGFIAMCNLLDETIPGLLGDDPNTYPEGNKE